MSSSQQDYSQYPSEDPNAIDKYLLHGCMMWIMWTVFSILMISMNRYLRGRLWKYRQWIHTLLGFVVFAITIYFSVFILNVLQQPINKPEMTGKPHAWFAYPTFYLVTLITFLGILSFVLLHRFPWNTRLILRVKFLHKVISYALILCGNAAIFTGIYGYRTNIWAKHPNNIPIELINIGLILFLFIIGEFSYQVGLVNEDPFVLKRDQKPITQEEFEQRVKNGENLVILDDLVLDITRFLLEHPGGTFSLKQNIGRDVSKFFHGGYSLENKIKVHEHRHSNDARKIVNDLIIGKLERASTFRQMKIKSLDRISNQAGSIKTFEFEDVQTQQNEKYDQIEIQDLTINQNSFSRSFEQNKVQNIYDDQGTPNKQELICPLIDPRAIGKHFLVDSQTSLGRNANLSCFPSSSGKHGIKRHYTQAYCMKFDVYESIIKIGQNQEVNQSIEKLKNAVHNDYNKNVTLTIKNYKKESGLSTFIHDEILKKSHQFKIQGPMGLALGVLPNGKHVAFTAGTGILVFIDLIAHLILRLLSQNPSLNVFKTNSKKDDQISKYIDLDNFQLELYSSFANEREAVGLELINLLEQLCQKFGKKNLFTHNSRLSSGKGIKWDENFFDSMFDEYEKKNQVKKVWICGPPILQENFERAVYKMKEKNIDYHSV